MGGAITYEMIETTAGRYTCIGRDYAHDVGYAAAVLDAEAPGWAERIDVDRLNLGSPTHCILGQLYAPTTIWQKLDHKHNGDSCYGRGCRLLRPDLKGINLIVFVCDAIMRPLWLNEIAVRLCDKGDTQCSTPVPPAARLSTSLPKDASPSPVTSCSASAAASI